MSSSSTLNRLKEVDFFTSIIKDEPLINPHYKFHGSLSSTTYLPSSTTTQGFGN